VRGIILIELNDVTKIYDGQKVPAVENLDLKVNEGETCVFVGPSGCGKSTILRMINRMIEQTSGPTPDTKTKLPCLITAE
jgi:osmoprotectant transport system ATP-binding protein